MYEWNFNAVWACREQLLRAFFVTLELNVFVLLVGTLIGILLGLVGSIKFTVVRFVIRVYVDLFRTLPILVMLVWFFFCVPILLGGIRISAFKSAVIVLSLNLSAFVAEIVRAGLEAVPRMHIEAGRATGLSAWQTTLHVTMPIALRIMVPPLVGQYINSIKLSVLSSVIAVPELLNRTVALISQTYRPLEFYTVLAGLFLILLLPGTLWSRRLESRQHTVRSEKQ